jgi:hypothetical protein
MTISWIYRFEPFVAEIDASARTSSSLEKPTQRSPYAHLKAKWMRQ